MEFPSTVQALIARLDEATLRPDEAATCEGVKRALIDAIGSNGLVLPEELVATCANGYARRLLHKTDRYAVVIMVWAPGQGTPIHDHDGNWCVECVYQGEIRVVSYDLLGAPSDEIVSFDQVEEIKAGKGMAGSLIPPFDYHVIENVDDDVAVTVHVYGGEMQGCHAYRRRDDGTYQRERRALSYSDSD
ncbi:MAG: cysteine dioxygenase family protein [Planctomycetes bacterium]|nr:cysteine dioxygenase family protein [Planctomycetota bacterium]